MTLNPPFKLNVSARPVLYYFVSPRFGLEENFGGVFFNYTEANPDEGASTDQTTFGFNFASSMGLGSSWYFGEPFKE